MMLIRHVSSTLPSSKFKYKYFKLVFQYNLSSSTSTKYYMSDAYKTPLHFAVNEVNESAQ